MRIVECDRATNSHARFIEPGAFLDADLDRKRTIPTLLDVGSESLCLTERRTANRAYDMNHAGAMSLLGIADQRRDRLRRCVRGQNQGAGRTPRGALSPPANGGAQPRPGRARWRDLFTRHAFWRALATGRVPLPRLRQMGRCPFGWRAARGGGDAPDGPVPHRGTRAPEDARDAPSSPAGFRAGPCGRRPRADGGQGGNVSEEGRP